MFPIHKFLKQNKNWVVIAMVIFFGAAIASGLPPAAETGPVINLEQLFTAQFGDLGNLQEMFETLTPPALVLVIFFTNVTTMAQMLLLGFLAGLSPLFVLVVNGAMVGLVTGSIARAGLPLWIFVGLGLLPHGIFELSAFFICGALGLKFGYHCVASPLPGLSRKESFFHIWRETAAMLPLIITLLAVGALVEIYISKALLLKFLPM